MELIQSTAKDIKALSAFYSEVVNHLLQTRNYPKWTKDYPNEESVRMAISKGWQYMCFVSGELVGAVVLNEEPQGAYEIGNWQKPLSDGEYLVIHTLAVTPNKANQGIGGRIIDLCIEYAREKGYKAIRLDVVPDNIPATQLYMKKGFSYVGTGDLKRSFKEIPVFDLYELILD